MARCRWFEEDLGSEVVFWFGVAHVHHHSRHLPIPPLQEVDNDRLSQLRALGRHESRQTIDLASSEGLEGMKGRQHVSSVGHGVVVQEHVYLLPRQLDEKVEKFTFRHSARSSPSTRKVDDIELQGDRFVFPDTHRVIVLALSRLLNWGAPLASYLHGADAA